MSFTYILGGLASRLRSATGVDENGRPLPVMGKNVATPEIIDESSDPYLVKLTEVKYSKPEDPACV